MSGADIKARHSAVWRPTSGRDCVHDGPELPFPLLRQASLTEGLKMCLHRGVHGQETALEESAECGGSHFSHLGENKKKTGGLESF